MRSIKCLSAILPRVLARIFLFCENAQRMMRKKFFESILWRIKNESEISAMVMIAESTFGFGEKQEAGIFFLIAGLPYA